MKWSILILGLLLSIPASAFELVHTPTDSIMPVRTIDPDDNGVTVTYNFNGAYSVEDDLYPGTFNLKIPGFGTHCEAGEAAWPEKFDTFVIPDGYEASVQLISAETDTKQMRLCPSRLPLIDNSDEFYSRDNVLPVATFSGTMPESYVEADGIRVYRDRNILYVRVTPVTYNYQAGTIYPADILSYRVEFTQNENNMRKAGSGNVRHTADNEILDRMFTYAVDETDVDSGMKKSLSDFSYPSDLTTAPHYLILTVNSYRDAAEKLAVWKRKMGFNVKVIYNDSWTPNLIKSTVKEQYNVLDNLEYLLLLGDEQDLPGEKIQNYYTDYYYSCMDEEDNTPDIYSGRLSVENNSEANIVVDKIINYEGNPPKLPSFYTNAAHCAEFSDKNHDGYEDVRFTKTSEDIRNGLLSKGLNIERIYFYNQGEEKVDSVKPHHWSSYYASGEPIPDELKWPTFEWDGNAKNVSDAINSGVFYVLHRDHGGITCWGQPNFTISNIDTLHNGRYLPVVFSINCDTGMYQNSDNSRSTCFAESFLRKKNGGCVGIFAASTTSYSGPNDALIMEMFSQIWPDAELRIKFGSSYKPTSTTGTGTSVTSLGQILNIAKEKFGQYYGYDLKTRAIFHCFGDPSMRIYTAKPSAIEATYSMSEDPTKPGQKILNIKSSTPWVTVSKISYNGNVETGFGSSFSIPLSSDIATIYLSKANYIPQEAYRNPISQPIFPIDAEIVDISQKGNNLTVSYNVDEESADDVKITLNPIGNCGTGIYDCTSVDSHRDIDISGKQKGFYIVSLYVNGENKDNKKIMIK